MKRVLVFVMIMLLSFVLLRCESPQLKGAKVYLAQEKYDLAKEQLIGALEHNPKDMEANWLLGYIYGMDGDFVKMNEHFDACLALSGKHKKDVENNLKKYYGDHRNSGANYYNQAISAEGDENKKKLFEKAIEEFKVALLVRPNNIEVMNFIGDASRSLKDFSSSEEYYKRVLAVDPNNYRASYGLGLGYYIKGGESKNKDDLRNAEKYFGKALEIKPDEKNLLKTMAVLYTELEEPDKAVELYTKAIAKEPENTDLMFNLSSVYLNLKQTEKAYEMWKKIEDLNPDDSEVLYNIGSTLYEKENWKEASQYYEKVVKVDDKNAKVWQLLGTCYGRMGEAEKMKNAYKKADELNKK